MMASNRFYSLRESGQWCSDASVENRGGRETLPSTAKELNPKSSYKRSQSRTTTSSLAPTICGTRVNQLRIQNGTFGSLPLMRMYAGHSFLESRPYICYTAIRAQVVRQNGFSPGG